MSITYYEVSINELLKKLNDVLRDVPEVRIAVLFGSVTKRRFVRDIDIGVCLNSMDELKDLIKITNSLEDALRLPVDVVPLRKIPAKLRLKVLLNGVRVLVRDEMLYASLLSESLSETMDMDLKLRKTSGSASTKGTSRDARR